MAPHVGLIGLGEAGHAIAAGLRGEGGTVIAYDVRSDPDLRRRAAEAGVALVSSLAQLAAAADIVICLTSAKAALPIAAEIAAALGDRHLYADYNSAAPSLKEQIAETVERSGARFVDGAVMSAVPPRRHKVPVLVSGSGAATFAAIVTGWGMAVEVLGERAGQASAVKMLRSLLVKGLEALLIECALGAHRYGVTHRVLDSMAGSLPMDDWEQLASYLMTRTVLHGDRRAEELRQAVATLEAIGVEPHLAAAGARRLQEFAELHVAAELGDQPYSYQAVLGAMDRVVGTPVTRSEHDGIGRR